MKRLITIIIALVMTLFSVPDQGADQPPVATVKPPQTAITTSVEQVPEDNETTAETAFVGEVSKTETAVEIKETTVNESEVVTEEPEVFNEENVKENKKGGYKGKYSAVSFAGNEVIYNLGKLWKIKRQD